VADQVGGQPVTVLCQEPAGGELVERSVERECVAGDDANDVVPDSCRIPQPLQGVVGDLGPDGCVAAPVPVGLRLAEIVEQAGKPHLEGGTGVRGLLHDDEDVLLEREGLPSEPSE